MAEQVTSNSQLCKRIAVYLKDRYEAGQYGQHVTLLRDALAALQPAPEPLAVPAEHRAGSEPLSRLIGDLDYCIAHVDPTSSVGMALVRIGVGMRNLNKRSAQPPGSIAPETGALVSRFRNAVDAFLTSASNPGRAAAVLHDNTPGSPYHELVMAKIEVDAMLDAPVPPPPAPPINCGRCDTQDFCQNIRGLCRHAPPPGASVTKGAVG
jgi:hypothetical protein